MASESVTTMRAVDLNLLDVRLRVDGDVPPALDMLRRLYDAPEFAAGGAGRSVELTFQVAEGRARRMEVDGRSDRLPAGADPAALVCEAVFREVLVRSSDYVLVHAAAVEHRGRGLLLVGPPFAGKTTLGLALADRGLDYYSDDVAAVRRSDGRLHPFRRRAGVRLQGGGRDYRRVSSSPDMAERAPAGVVIGAVFLIEPAGLPLEAEAEEAWTLVLAPGATDAGSEILNHPALRIAATSEDRGRVRFDLIPQSAGSATPAALRDFVARRVQDILYVGPTPRRWPQASAVQPEVASLAREAAALELVRHTLNRQPGSALLRSYGEHPHLGIYADLLGARAAARCYRLRPGTPEATAEVVLGTIEGRIDPATGRPEHKHLGPSTAPARGAAAEEESRTCMRA